MAARRYKTFLLVSYFWTHQEKSPRGHVILYRKIPKISFGRGLYFSKTPFWGVYIRRGLRFKIDWASLIVGSNLPFLLCFTLYLTAILQVQAPGGLYLEGWFNGGFFALPVWGAYIWRSFYMEGLIFWILRYLLLKRQWNNKPLRCLFPAKVAIYYVAIATAILHINFSHEGLAGISLIGL